MDDETRRAWAEYQWPEWVPDDVRREIIEFWETRNEGPDRWIANGKQQPKPMPEMGRIVRTLWPLGECNRGRWIHCCNNTGRIVKNNGDFLYVSTIDLIEDGEGAEADVAPGELKTTRRPDPIFGEGERTYYYDPDGVEWMMLPQAEVGEIIGKFWKAEEDLRKAKDQALYLRTQLEACEDAYVLRAQRIARDASEDRPVPVAVGRPISDSEIRREMAEQERDAVAHVRRVATAGLDVAKPLYSGMLRAQLTATILSGMLAGLPNSMNTATYSFGDMKFLGSCAEELALEIMGRAEGGPKEEPCGTEPGPSEAGNIAEAGEGRKG